MAVTIDIAVPAKGDLTFDFTNQLITAEDTIDVLTAQELANALRDAEDENALSMSFKKIADMSGKGNIGDTVSGIQIELLGWHIVSGKTSGKFIVSEGTTTETTDGVDIFAINNLVSQINIVQIGGAIAETGVSGLTPPESTALSRIDTSVVYLKKIVDNKKVLVKSGSTWHLIIYDNDGISAIMDKELKDKDGNDITDFIAGTLAQELLSSV